MATTKIATLRVSNMDLWNAARSLSPSFASTTPEGTKDLFTERGFGEITAQGMAKLNEFFGIIMPYSLNLINVSHAKDPLDRADVGEYYEDEYGEYSQRMAVNSIKPISPAYRNLKNGPGPDPFVIRKPEIATRFFGPNFDFASMITQPDAWTTKRIFISEYGYSELLAGIFAGLENGYTIQKYEAKKEAINAALNNPDLKPTQIINVDAPDQPTEDQIISTIATVKNVLSVMDTTAQTAAYNSMGFQDSQDISRLRLLVRAGWKTKWELLAARNSYHRDVLNIGIPTVEVSDFGGLIPTHDGTPVYPTYDYLGAVNGFSTTQPPEGDVPDTREPEFTEDEITYTDPNANVWGVLMDKGAIFEIRRNPYEVEAQRNARGKYTNYFASSPNNTIAFDKLYTFIKFVNGG